MKIYTLLENTTSNPELKCTHGLSLYIETEECNILFDCGPDDSFYENAVKMGVNLEEADFCVLSHGHYDHGGGLETFLNINSKAKVFISPDAFGEYYSEKEDGYEYIGLNKKLKEYEDRLIYVAGVTEIENFLIFGNVKPGCCDSPANRSLYIRNSDGTYSNDSFSHEQDLVITENGKDYLFSGCAHNGVVNILHEYEHILGSAPAAVFGGFHFNPGKLPYEKVKDAVEQTCEELQKYPGTMFYTGHCTGDEAYAVLKERLGSRIERISTGRVFSL